MSKRKVMLASKSGLAMPSRQVPYGHKRLGRKKTHAIRLEEERPREIRRNPRPVAAKPPIIRKPDVDEDDDAYYGR